VPALQAALRELPPQRLWTRVAPQDPHRRDPERAHLCRRHRLRRPARAPCTGEDITAYRAAEAETSRLREQLALTLDGMYEAVCLFSRDGRSCS